MIKEKSILKTLRDASRRPSFSELEHFRNIIVSEPDKHLQPYTVAKSKVTFYRVLFGSIATVFCFLGAFLAWRIPSPFSHLLFTNTYWMQGTITCFTLLVALFSGTISIILRTEREAMQEIAGRAKVRLKRLYQWQMAKIGWKSFWPFAPEFFQASDIKKKYFHSLNAIEKRKEELIHLFHKIGKSTPLQSEIKETLYNQALLEFSHSVDQNVDQFETLSLH